MVCDVESLATTLIAYSLRGLAKECALEGHTVDEME